jgi:N6-adenosine-specific RNA methylase IME4/ParB-like chromosome segregation protein Spo0J
MGIVRRPTLELRPHPLSAEIYGPPELDADFLDSIERFGILTPLSILSDGTILSGHRRWYAATELGFDEVPVRVQAVEDELSVQRTIIESNRQRDKTFSQKMREAECLERIERETRELERREKISQYRQTGETVDDGPPSKSRDKVAEAVGIGSGRQYSRAKKVWEAAKSGDEVAVELVERLDREEATVTAAVRELNKAKQKKECEERVDNTFENPPAGRYRTIVIDPPWPVTKIVRDVRPNQDTMSYPTMTLDEIARIPIPEIAMEDGCHVYLWATHKYLPQAIKLFDKWGVKYQCLMTWVKPTGMTPFTWMYNTEHVLFGRVGSLKVKQMGLKLSFEAPSRGHSTKPDVFYERVLAASPGPRLDMFARQARDGFTAWGDESGIQDR